MNKIMRRLARTVLGTSNAAANQTVQLDLGWMTMKAEIKLKRMKLALKLLKHQKQGTIVQDVLLYAI